MYGAAENGRNPASKHQIQPGNRVCRIRRLTPGGTAKPASRDQILRRERVFPVQLATSRFGNLTRLVLTLQYLMTIHLYMRNARIRKIRFLIVKCSYQRKALFDLVFVFSCTIGAGLRRFQYVHIQTFPPTHLFCSPSRKVWILGATVLYRYSVTVVQLHFTGSLKENLNASLLSIPLVGGRNVKPFRGDHRLQRQNLFMALKRVPRWYTITTVAVV